MCCRILFYGSMWVLELVGWVELLVVVMVGLVGIVLVVLLCVSCCLVCCSEVWCCLWLLVVFYS